MRSQRDIDWNTRSRRFDHFATPLADGRLQADTMTRAAPANQLLRRFVTERPPGRPRTTGLIQLATAPPGPAAIGAVEEFSDRFPETAGRKIVAIDFKPSPPRVAVYQVSAGQADLCVCANAVAAVLSVLLPAGIAAVEVVLP